MDAVHLASHPSSGPPASDSWPRGGRAPRALAARALRQSPAAASPPTARFANQQKGAARTPLRLLRLLAAQSVARRPRTRPPGRPPALCPPCCPRVSCAVACAHVLLPRGVRDVPDPVSDEEVFLSPSRRLPAGAVSRRRALRSCRVVRPRPASPRPAALCCSSALRRPWPLPPSRPPQKTRRSRSSVGRLCARRQGFISRVVYYRLPTP